MPTAPNEKTPPQSDVAARIRESVRSRLIVDIFDGETAAAPETPPVPASVPAAVRAAAVPQAPAVAADVTAIVEGGLASGPVEAPEMVSEILGRAAELVRSVGVESEPAEVSEGRALRAPCGTKTRVTVWARYWSEDLKGHRTVEGAALVGSAGPAQSANTDAYRLELSEKRLVPRMRAAAANGVLARRIQEDGEAILFPRQPTAYFCRGCEGCGGAGRLGCDSCGNHGEVPCGSVFCRNGRTSCSTCGGRGQQRGHDGRWHYCYGCAGTGLQNCMNCGGSTVVRCSPCRGYGYFKCTPCAETGQITQVHCYELVMKTETSAWVAELFDKHDVVSWMRGGSKGHVDAIPTGSQPSMMFSRATLAKEADEPGNHPCFTYSVSGSVVQGQVKGSVSGHDFHGWCTRLDGKVTRFAPFLDKPAAALASGLAKLARELSPSAFRADAERLGGLGMVLDVSQKSGIDEKGTAEAISAFFSGAIAPKSAEALAAPQAACIARFGDTAARAAWKWPARLLPLVAAAPFLMDLPWTAYHERDPVPASVAAFAVMAAILALVLVADAMGRGAVRREVGSAKLFRPNLGRRRLAAVLAMAAGAGMFLPQAGVAASGFRSATHEFREIVGLPHIECMRPGAAVVAAGCGATR